MLHNSLLRTTHPHRIPAHETYGQHVQLQWRGFAFLFVSEGSEAMLSESGPPETPTTIFLSFNENECVD